MMINAKRVRVKIYEVQIHLFHPFVIVKYAYTIFKNFQHFTGLFKFLFMTVTHLSESGGTFIQARLTWVRLKAELKNCRKVGRESLAFLQSDSKEEDRR